ncbi:hypothetical protein TNCT_22821 [Trichonephila clavata]|uniref:Uncharacterized protein n=1 Tax=Trichonephila clavata TaxID=2740835 RepID=A0A8X6KX64_TRICU|nr:hypothetical protein TNCT_22821 [Trichonephila clavata]
MLSLCYKQNDGAIDIYDRFLNVFALVNYVTNMSFTATGAHFYELSSRTLTVFYEMELRQDFEKCGGWKFLQKYIQDKNNIICKISPLNDLNSPKLNKEQSISKAERSNSSKANILEVSGTMAPVESELYARCKSKVEELEERLRCLVGIFELLDELKDTWIYFRTYKE